MLFVVRITKLVRCCGARSGAAPPVTAAAAAPTQLPGNRWGRLSALAGRWLGGGSAVLTALGPIAYCIILIHCQLSH